VDLVIDYDANALADLIRKRHEGPGWVVLHEVANGTGGNAKRRADAIAIGIWASHGHAIHGFEVKISRGDVQRELGAPWKSDAVGKFCDYWWLVISDPKIIDGLVIPETWGILAPKNRVLRAIRKAPKLEAQPFNRSFFASLARNVVETWVPKHEHAAVKEAAFATAKADLETERRNGREDAVAELADLKKRIAEFESASGVRIDRYQSGRIGDAVRYVLDARHDVGAKAVERDIRVLEQSSHHHEAIARRARQAIEALQQLTEQATPSEDERAQGAA
jgi:hypothetical protein